MITQNKQKKEFVFIYNQYQSEFYFSKGIVPVKVDRGSKGDIYVKFKNTDEVEKAFTEWCNKNK